MQSGKAKTRQWVLEFDPAHGQATDTMMGWKGGGDTTQQVRMKFATLEAAEAYAKKNGLAAEVAPAHTPRRVLKSYADRFAYTRVG